MAVIWVLTCVENQEKIQADDLMNITKEKVLRMVTPSQVQQNAIQT